MLFVAISYIPPYKMLHGIKGHASFLLIFAMDCIGTQSIADCGQVLRVQKGQRNGIT